MGYSRTHGVIGFEYSVHPIHGVFGSDYSVYPIHGVIGPHYSVYPIHGVDPLIGRYYLTSNKPLIADSSSALLADTGSNRIRLLRVSTNKPLIANKPRIADSIMGY